MDWASQFPFSTGAAIAAGRLIGEREACVTSKGDVQVGSDVWIGSGARIMSGVTIGDGAVVAACSVVTKNVAPYTIVAGNPASQRRTRFTPDVIDRLLGIAWWNWDAGTIAANVDLLCSQPTPAVLQRLEKIRDNIERRRDGVTG